MKKYIAVLLTVTLICSFGLTGCGTNSASNSKEATAENPMVLTLAHGLSESHTVHIAMLQFAEEVKQKTNGRIIIKIFPNGQLGSETENLEQLQAGVIAMTKVSAPGLATYNDAYNTFGLPYIFSNIDEFYKIDENINWNLYKDLFVEYIRTRRRDFLVQIPISSTNMEILLTNKINQFKDYYWKKNLGSRSRMGSRLCNNFVHVPLALTIDTINFAKNLVKDTKNLMVGGVLATIQAKEVYEATGIKPFKGILNIPGQLDKRNQLIIDNLPLDYSILDEIEYKYPMNNAYYGYTTRGCIRKCPFCAVPKLEPVYNS